MARIEYRETPAGPHEFGDSTTTIIMSEEEYDLFMKRLEEEPKDLPKLRSLMQRDFPWSKED